MKILKILLALSLILISGFTLNNKNSLKIINGQKFYKNIHHYNNPCKANTDVNRHIMENFLTSSDWSTERQETETNGLTVSQISLVQSSENVCQDLNQEYSQIIAQREGPNNDKVYDVTFYKAGSFYFVVISLAEPSDPDVVSVGLSFLDVYNQNLNRLAGYSF